MTTAPWRGIGPVLDRCQTCRDGHCRTLAPAATSLMPRSSRTCAKPRRACSPLSPPAEDRVLRMRFGIGMNTDHTLEEVGQQFSVTRERIRQIEAKALRKLKHPSRSRKLRSFLDN